MSSVKTLNPQSEVSRRDQALRLNVNAAKGLQDVLKTNLGPKGTIKMLVSGAGDIKLTKDGNVLLHEMQIQHPTAALIARAATAQDDMTGDGTTSNVLVIGELMKHSERYIDEGVHPRVITDGFEIAKKKALEFLETYKTTEPPTREQLIQVALTSLKTKLQSEIATQLSTIVVDSILLIKKEDNPVDLFMVEIMHMKHLMATETRLIKGIVMDHGARHPDMPKSLTNCYILTCNVSMEYEKSEVNSSLFYSSAEQRIQLANAERKMTDLTVQRAIKLKQKVCDTPDKHFVIVNQKGIDPISLQMLADEGIIALRRAKRRNMERLTLACGGVALNALEDDIDVNVLGYAERVYEYVLGEDKYTFVEGCKDPKSCTILLQGPDDHTITQLKDATRDGLRAVNNAVNDKCLIAGAGSFEVELAKHLTQEAEKVQGKQKIGVRIFADAILVIPKTLAENAGFDTMDTILKLQEAAQQKQPCGLDITTGNTIDPTKVGIWDNYCVKKQLITAAPVVSAQLLLVDVIMRAGKAAPQVAPGAGHPVE